MTDKYSLPAPDDIFVARLSRRTAHATYALIVTARDVGFPPYAREVVIHDPEAPSVSATAASRLPRPLAVHTLSHPAIWCPTQLAYRLYPALEARFLRDTEAY